MPTTHTGWTVDMVHALPDDGNRYEVIDGELFVTPAPSMLHQRASRELVALLLPYCRASGFELFYAPTAVTWSNRREVQPDILVLPVAGKGVDRFEDVGRLLLAVEIVSPTTVRADRFRKRDLYQSEGVPEYWVVDPALRTVERWRPEDREPEVLLAELDWQPGPGHPPLVVKLSEYFRAVHGD